MIYLLLAILSSSCISVLMRLGSSKAKDNIAMLAMNYVMCTVVAAAYAGFDLLPLSAAGTPFMLGMGLIQGIQYLVSFVLFQWNIKKIGVVLPTTFMRLGLLVPMVVSIFLFGEIPTAVQIVGFVIALFAIILISFQKQTSAAKKGIFAQLILLLLISGTGDVLSKIFEEFGNPALAPQFLFYIFATALVLCIGLMLHKKQRPGKYEILYGLLIGIPNFFSAKFLLAALSDLPAVIVCPTNSAATLLVVTLAGVCFFKERLSKRQWTALGLILVALVLLNI